MARSLLGSFVSGTRQMLTLQLFVSVGTVALAGYSLGVTNDLIRQRNQLNERIIQLETALAAEGVTPPAMLPEPLREAEAPTDYPGETTGEEVVVAEREPEPAPAAEAPETAPPPTAEPAPPAATAEPTPAAPPEPEPAQPPRDSAGQQPANPALDAAAALLRDLLTPPPPLRTLVLHVRRPDYDEAQNIAARLANSGLAISITIMSPEDQAPAGFSYYHGRQSRPAADVARSIQDAARGAEIAQWAVQLRGAALPAQGDYSADRLDVVLPALPAPPSDLRLQRQIDPRVLRAPPVADRPPG